MTTQSDPGLALDMLHGASGHIREEWSVRLDRDAAKANLDARAILFNCANRILREFDLGISKEEIEGAVIIERSIQS